MQGVSKTGFENYVKASDAVLRNMQNQGQGLQNQMTNLTEMLSKFISSNTASSSSSGPLTPLVPTTGCNQLLLKEPEQNPGDVNGQSEKIKFRKYRTKPNSYQPKLPYPERMKVREKDTPSAQQSRFMKLFKQLRLEIGLKDALIEMPKFNKWLSTLLRNKEKLEEIAITTQLDRTNALADSRASINLLPHSIYKQLGLGALKPTRMTLELANRSVTHPMGIAKDVVVRVDGFTFLADFVVVNFEPDPRVPIILGRPFLRTAKALIDLYEEKLTLRVGNEPFSGSTTNHSDALPPSSSPVKTSNNLEEFADELTLLKKDVHEENFQVYSNPLFEFDDDFNSSNVNPLFNAMVKDVENEDSNVLNSDELVLLNTPFSDNVECSDPEGDIDEINAFLAMEVSSNFEEGYYDSEGDSPKIFPASPIPVEDSDHVQEEIDIFSGDLIPPGVENDDSEDEDNSTFLPDCWENIVNRLYTDDYDTWAMEMEHYLEYIDNEVWKMIQNGNSKKRVTKGKDGVYRFFSSYTGEQFADEKKGKLEHYC
ncbi:reverse transcriptase domain-containing protein [Tanacetum coccineum]